ncbi:helix-turn-helix domain-containing protein [Phenylobacterium sp.]|jgi:transcriptional regulator with XRE-family HTH domain|uniref:helix-turn-helix domain-containing protein n=1 Tax=Phenylobacterium sp. TaxID=1871053 RepID=UPI0030022AA1
MVASVSIHPVDLHVGMRLRLRRRELKVTQSELAGHLGISFQQVQKYERGMNRLSASRLYEIARILRVGVEYFFEGFEGVSSNGGQTAA